MAIKLILFIFKNQWTQKVKAGENDTSEMRVKNDTSDFFFFVNF